MRQGVNTAIDKQNPYKVQISDEEIQKIINSALTGIDSDDEP
jgi:hypothetical protein